jgi:hypothetical protein
MREQRVIRVRNAVVSQGCYIMQLSCGHNQRVPVIEVHVATFNILGAKTWICQACPDEPVREYVRPSYESGEEY